MSLGPLSPMNTSKHLNVCQLSSQIEHNLPSLTSQLRRCLNYGLSERRCFHIHEFESLILAIQKHNRFSVFSSSHDTQKEPLLVIRSQTSLRFNVLFQRLKFCNPNCAPSSFGRHTLFQEFSNEQFLCQVSRPKKCFAYFLICFKQILGRENVANQELKITCD